MTITDWIGAEIGDFERRVRLGEDVEAIAAEVCEDAFCNGHRFDVNDVCDELAQAMGLVCVDIHTECASECINPEHMGAE